MASLSSPPSRSSMLPRPHREGRTVKVVETDAFHEKSFSAAFAKLFKTKPSFLQAVAQSRYIRWIPQNWTWSKLKPVIRSATAAWIAVVLFVIIPVEKVMGTASFLILVASVLSPPVDPFVAVLERELLLSLLVSATWAYSCLAIKLADLARSHHDPTVTFNQALSGRYIEAGPTVILAVFMFIGSAILLYIKAHQGPGPYVMPCILACLTLDIAITTSVLFPYPFYGSGQAVVVPTVFHSAVALIVSIFVFPATISSQFTLRLQAVFSPLITAIEKHQSLLESSPHSPEFAEAAAEVGALVEQSEGGLISLAASARLLPSDLIYCRYAPKDFVAFQNLGRRIVGRADGMGMYFALIDPTRLRLPVTPAASVPVTPVMTRTPTSPVLSRNPSFERVRQAADGQGQGQGQGHGQGPEEKSHHHDHPHRHSHFWYRKQHHHALYLRRKLHHSILHGGVHWSRLREEGTVAMFESYRYLNLEATHFHDPDTDVHTARATALLGESCREMLGSCREALIAVRDWLTGVRNDRFNIWISKQDKKLRWEKRMAEFEALRGRLSSVVERFRNDGRLRVIDPYRPVFEPSELQRELDVPAHRHLFHCFVYQYHLMQFSDIAIEMLDEVIRLEKTRKRNKLWTPVNKLFQWNKWQISESVDNGDEEDPDLIQGKAPMPMYDLGIPHRRDADALPPVNKFESFTSFVYFALVNLGGGNVLYAVKAGILSVLLCLPSFFKHSTKFAYENRFVWGIFMGQLALSRFHGETAFSLVVRITFTLFGGVIGLVMWYISAGSGNGTPYSLAAVCAVCFPMFFFARLYWPASPMTTIVFVVTTMLVIGYSFQDRHRDVPGNPGSGWDVAYKRFILVAVGVFCAFIMSLFPPSTTIRKYQRVTLATTSAELGTIYCAMVSFANTKERKNEREREDEIREIVTSLIAVRSKLRRSKVLTSNVNFEFSMKGRWPSERYTSVLNIQLQIAYALSHLTSIFKHLDPPWARALLTRTRFSDPDFQGDVLAIITMISSSLRTGAPLPQITPCPLIDRFMQRSHSHGFDVIYKDAEEDFGLPRTLTFETLQNEQYLMFCVGVSTAFSIVARLDRLMVAAKEVVGEQYHIYGLGLGVRGAGAESERPSVVHLTPPQDV